MSEPSPPANQHQTIELTKAISQLLSSMGQSGIQTLPRATGHGVGKFFSEVTPATKSTVDLSGESKLDHPVRESRPAYDQSLQTEPTPISESLFPVSESTPSTSTNLPLGKLPLSERVSQLQILEQTVSSCKRCSELAACRTKTVFGAGNPQPRLVFLGEAPGADEDRQGVPFVGAAGQLLNRIINAAGLIRNDVYILNTIKCRPPGNRNPLTAEMDNCWEYTQRQLEILAPEFICCLGLVASRRLLNTDQPLGKMRQKFHDYRGIKVLVTYHPSYLLRTESAKKHAWADIKMLLKEMGMEIPN